MNKSILEELKNYVPSQNKKTFIELKASNIMYSLINFLNLLENSFDEKDYEILLKKIILSTKTKNPKKFLEKLYKTNLKKENKIINKKNK